MRIGNLCFLDGHTVIGTVAVSKSIKEDCLTAFYVRLVLTRKCTSVQCSN